MKHAVITLIFAALAAVLGASGCSSKAPEETNPKIVDKAKTLPPIMPGNPGKQKGPATKST